MKTTTFRLALVVATLACTSQLFSAEWNADVSALYLPDEKDTGVGVALGTRLPGNHYIGAEILYFRIKDKASFGGFSTPATSESISTGLTYKYFAPLTQQKNLFAYFGTGIGLTSTELTADVRLDGRRVSVTDTSSGDFSYQFLVGIQSNLTENAVLKFGYRYLDVQNMRFGKLRHRDDFDTNAVELGVGIRF